MKAVTSVALGIFTATGGFIDAGAIATAAAAGAQFGLGLVWAMLLATLGVMLLVEQAGRLAAVSGKTYADAIRERFGFRFYLVPLTSEVMANTLLLAADIGGMAIGLALFTGVSWHIMLPISALIVFAMIWRAPFTIIENVPSLLGLVTLTFWVGIVASGGITDKLLATLTRPQLVEQDLGGYFFLAAAILGAVVSPYLLFFYSTGAGEEGWSRRSLGLNRITAVLGMGFGSTTAIALMLISAIVLQPHGILGTNLPEIGLTMAATLGQTGAFLFAFALFTTCLGGALEASLSTSYNVSQGFGWEWGEDKAPVKAPRFNLLLLLFLALALVVSMIGGDPLSLALIGSAFTALTLPIALSPFLVLMNDKSYLAERTNGRLSNLALIGVLVVGFVVAVVSIPLLLLTGG
ncbi:MAG: divalent metal cation transporter [Candidatus Limnocylindrales bacterium]